MTNDPAELTLRACLFGERPHTVFYCGHASADYTGSSPRVVVNADTAVWVLAAVQQLERLGKLKPDWDSYGGLPLNPRARACALDMLRCLEKQELPIPNVALGSGGTVHLEWDRGGKALELGLGEERGVGYVKVTPDGSVEEGQVAANLEMRLRELSSWFLGGRRDMAGQP